MYPTLEEVLQLPVLRAAAPRVRAGSAGLGVRVRWVHVSEQRNPAGTLTGGELVLSIGVALADPATDLAAYVAALQDAGAAGLVVELGQHVRSLPSALVDAAREASLPLVELGRAVRFVEVTEVVHARILTSQLVRLQFTQRVSDAFRTLAVEGGGASRVLTEAASFLDLPVVLEDLGHRALSYAGSVPAAVLLKDWTARSRQVASAAAGPAVSGPEGWLTTPVGARSRRWGRLVLPQRVVDEDKAEQCALVLQHAADALTVGRLLGDDSLDLEMEAQGELLQDLLHSTTLDEQALRARARALGLPTGGPLSILVVGGTPADDEDRALVEAAVAAVRTTRTPAIVGRVAPARVAIVLSCRPRESDGEAVERIVALLGNVSASAAGVAGPVSSFTQLAAAVAEAAFVVDVTAATTSSGPVRVRRASDLGARGLLWQLRTDPRLLSYVDGQLGPVLRLDDPLRGQMLSTLSAYLEVGGGMTAFAAAVGVSRPAAYARLARLRQLLDADLEQASTRVSLHLAVMALQQGRQEVSTGEVDPGERRRSARMRPTTPAGGRRR